MKQFENQVVVITGGAGFIGSGVVRALNDQGMRNLVVVDDLGSDEKWKNLVGKRFLELLHKAELFKWLEGKEKKIGAFIHLGACSSTVETDANYLLENNTRYSIRLAEYAFLNGIRFIYASSAATYGDGALGFSDEHDKMESYKPLNMYGYSKHLFDLWLKDHSLLHRAVGLKYFNVFGPNEYHKGRMASALLKMVPSALKEGEIRLFKSSDPDHYQDGEQKRDFIYVKDAVEMTVQFLHNNVTGIFNIGTGVPHSWNDLAKAVFKALDLPAKIEYIDMPVDLKGKYQNYTCANMGKSKNMGLKMPRYTLESATEDYVKNYLQVEGTW